MKKDKPISLKQLKKISKNLKDSDSWKMPRQYSMVKICGFWLKTIEDTGYTLDHLYQEAKKRNVFIFLGDIPNMQGHCIVVSVQTGKIFSCYHTEDFEELSEDEV